QVPSVRHRLRLQTTHGIPAEAWSLEPTGPAPPAELRSRLALPVALRPGSVLPSSSSSSGTTPAPVSSKLAAAAATEAQPARAPASPPKGAGAAAEPTTMQGVETLLRTIRQHRGKPGLLAAES